MDDLLPILASQCCCDYSLPFFFPSCPLMEISTYSGRRCMKTMFLDCRIGGNFILFFAQKSSISSLFLWICSQTISRSVSAAARCRLIFLLFINQQQTLPSNKPQDTLLGCGYYQVAALFAFFKQSIIQVIRQMQDLRMERLGKSILRSLGQITKNRMNVGDSSLFTDGGREKHHSKPHKYSRKQSCNASHLSKMFKNSSASTQKSLKGNWEKENLYIYDIPVAPKFKRRTSQKPARNQIQKTFDYSQIKSCLDISEAIPTAMSAKNKKGNSVSSTCYEAKSHSKQARSHSKSKPLGDLLMRSSVLLQEYQGRCRELLKENGQIRQKYEALQKKLKRLTKNRPNDIVHVF